MAEFATLARPYAIAAYDIATASDRRDEWSQALMLLAQATIEPGVQDLIGSPSLSAAQKAHHIRVLLEDELREDQRRFVAVLADNHRLELLPSIASEFEAMRAEDDKTLDVVLTTAIDLTPEEIREIVDALEVRFERTISATTVVDESIVGGAIVRAGDTVFDGSVRGKLEKMRDALLRR